MSAPDRYLLNTSPIITAMIKAAEMKCYDAFIKSLPEDSYLRPWLSDIRDCVETDLRNDIIPDRTPRDCYAQGQQIIKDAQAEAKRALENAEIQATRIRSEASDKAAVIIKNAEVQAEYVRRELREDVVRLSRALEAVA